MSLPQRDLPDLITTGIDFVSNAASSDSADAVEHGVSDADIVDSLDGTKSGVSDAVSSHGTDGAEQGVSDAVSIDSLDYAVSDDIDNVQSSNTDAARSVAVQRRLKLDSDELAQRYVIPARRRLNLDNDELADDDFGRLPIRSPNPEQNPVASIRGESSITGPSGADITPSYQTWRGRARDREEDRDQHHGQGPECRSRGRGDRNQGRGQQLCTAQVSEAPALGVSSFGLSLPVLRPAPLAAAQCQPVSAGPNGSMTLVLAQSNALQPSLGATFRPHIMMHENLDMEQLKILEVLSSVGRHVTMASGFTAGPQRDGIVNMLESIHDGLGSISSRIAMAQDMMNAIVYAESISALRRQGLPLRADRPSRPQNSRNSRARTPSRGNSRETSPVRPRRSDRYERSREYSAFLRRPARGYALSLRRSPRARYIRDESRSWERRDGRDDRDRTRPSRARLPSRSPRRCGGHADRRGHSPDYYGHSGRRIHRSPSPRRHRHRLSSSGRGTYREHARRRRQV